MNSNQYLNSYKFANQYRTGISDPVNDFYIPCLNKSVEYKRAVGYFRSSVYLIVGKPTLEFAKRGGKIKLICSPILETEDVNTIMNSQTSLEKIGAILLSEIEELIRDNEMYYRTKTLGTLIECQALEIRLAINNSRNGIYHEKLGIFTDENGFSVSFIGSSNETWNGWHFQGNYECIEVFSEYSNLSDKSRVENHIKYFDNLWNNLVPGLRIVSLPVAVTNKLLSIAEKSLERIDYNKFNLKSVRTLYPHQELALENWEKSGQRGIFKHATGSGKTFTAITAIKKHLQKGNPCLVVVPNTLLLKQWKKEVLTEIQNAIILVCGGTNSFLSIKKKLAAMTAPELVGTNRIIIATMQSAATESFISEIVAGNHLMIVVDEVHQIGSPEYSRVLSIESGPRIGLSATPERYRDPIGTQIIFSYFHKIIDPIFSLSDAIKAKRLVEYEYYPSIIRLNDEECEEWENLSKAINREIAKTNSDTKKSLFVSEKAKRLMIKRARVAKKASGKVLLVKEIILKYYEEGQHWLIYCEDRFQLAEVIEALKELKFNPIEYFSNMHGDREASISGFIDFGGILVSIKCLDEGIDIPSISHAIILASSQNPRQFIQRRGRVLRTAPNKHMAYLFDAIVFPTDILIQESQLPLLKSEYARSLEFSKSAINANAQMTLRLASLRLGLDPDQLEDDYQEAKDGNI